jgi:GxxExxY protein
VISCEDAQHPLRGKNNRQLKGIAMTELIYKQESYELVNAAIAVWQTLGYGFLEKVYENALAVEFRKRSIPFEQQKPITVLYEGECVGDYFADFVVYDKIILELKTAREIANEHLAQTLNYLKATELKLALILNFGPK